MIAGFWIVFVLAARFGTVSPYLYQVRTLEVPVDHFSFSRNDSFHVRYLVNDTYWNRESGPIFLYTGNEGAIELFADNTGFVWEIAPSFEALVVFAEHRYYGGSLPFGNKSFASPDSTGFLTSQQAMADYIDLIDHLRENQTRAHKSPVIAFGGSYGGMLAAYIRMKYPHHVAGAVAASAPIWQFTGMTPCNAFYRIATSVYEYEDKNCSDSIRKSWGVLDRLGPQGLDRMSGEWKMCKPLTVDTLRTFKAWLQDTYVNLAMANYPYPAKFLADLPGYPVRAFCSHLRNYSNTDRALLSNLFRAVSVYFNNSGTVKCFDWTRQEQSNLDTKGWDFQSCTEMVMPMCADNINDMFEKLPWDIKRYSDKCWATWKVHPQPSLAEKMYGGKMIEDASNIIFSNGLLDPWTSGGVLKSNSKAITIVLIAEGAHHLDLRGSNPADPESVRQARALYQKTISKWISKYRDQSKKT